MITLPKAPYLPAIAAVRMAAVLSRMIRGSTGRPSSRRLADLLAGNEHRLLVRVVVHQIDAAERLIEGGKADQQRMDLQVARQVVEDLLGVEIAPDRLAVVIRGVGVLCGR